VNKRVRYPLYSQLPLAENHNWLEIGVRKVVFSVSVKQATFIFAITSAKM